MLSFLIKYFSNESKTASAMSQKINEYTEFNKLLLNDSNIKKEKIILNGQLLGI